MTDTPPSPPTVKARLPRGFADRGPAEIAATNRMLEAIRASYELYGFEAVETPFLEFTEALGKFLPEEISVLEAAVDRAADAVEYANAHGMEAAMNIYNQKPTV